MTTKTAETLEFEIRELLQVLILLRAQVAALRAQVLSAAHAIPGAANTLAEMAVDVDRALDKFGRQG